MKLVQLIKPLYLRGLNMFALRQLNAKVNTAFASLSVVCLVLFLAITSVCGGIGIRNAIDGSLDKSTGYSASVSTSFGSYNRGGAISLPNWVNSCRRAAGPRYGRGLRASVAAVGAGDLDAAASCTAQIDFLVDPADGLVMDDVERASGLKLSDYAGASVNSGYGAYPVYLAKLSQVNAALELAGRPALELGAGECAVFSDLTSRAGSTATRWIAAPCCPWAGATCAWPNSGARACRPRRFR